MYENVPHTKRLSVQSSVGKFLKFGFCLQGYANFASYNMILHMLIGTTKH